MFASNWIILWIQGDVYQIKESDEYEANDRHKFWNCHDRRSEAHNFFCLNDPSKTSVNFGKRDYRTLSVVCEASHRWRWNLIKNETNFFIKRLNFIDLVLSKHLRLVGFELGHKYSTCFARFEKFLPFKRPKVVVINWKL